MGEWTRENLAWVTGIVEGEGSISSIQETGKRAIRIAISISMTDVDVLESVQRILGVGTLTGPYDRSRHGCVKPQWVYTIVGKQALAVGAAIWPWLHERRRAQFAYAATRWIEAYRIRNDPVRRFAEMVATADDGCLVWLGHVAASGAGAFYVSEHRKRSAHSYLYELRHGEAPPYCRKTCATPGCIEHWTPIRQEAAA